MAKLWWIGPLLLLATGCPSALKHDPRTDLVEAEGLEKTRTKLEFYLKTTAELYGLSPGQLEAYRSERQVEEDRMRAPDGSTAAFAAVARAVIYDTRKIYVRGADDGLFCTLRVHNMAQARNVVNLILSLAEHARGGS